MKTKESFLRMIHQYGRLSVAMTAFLLFCSCETDSYDTGDGNFSYLNADFVIAHTAGEKEIDYAVNDDDEKILLKPHVTAQWATTPDSLYRALLYYNKVKKDGEGMRAFRISQVHVLQPKDRREIENIITDPLTLQSVWMSHNGKYLNMGLDVKTGKPDEPDRRQLIGVMRDTTITAADGMTHVYLRLLHNQNDVPEYYTSTTYASIPLTDSLRRARIHLLVNTYNGEIERVF